MINKLRQELKNAMVSKDEIKKNAVKSVINRANLGAKENKTDITDEIVISAIKKEIKQLAQTMDILKENNKTDCDLYKITELQRNYLETYLPKQMSEEDIRKEVVNIINKESDKSKLMKVIMASLKGKADNKLISEIAREEINKLS